ncbi:MAG TPA: CDP-alcohol phosphatidyltransferase family protein [Actinomycetota bacterium]
MTRQHRRPAPRMRDLPAPRKNPSLAGPLFRTVWAWPYRFALAGLHRMGVRPWQLTLLSLINNAICGWLIVSGRHFLGGILLLPAGLFDVFDGGVARLRGEESRKGALLDAVNDRLADGIVFGAILYSLVDQGLTGAGKLALAALVVSLFVSHVRAEGEARGVDMSGGLFQRLERYIALMFGLTAPGMLAPVLAVLTGLGAFTILQRGVHAWRRLPRAERQAP